MAKSLYWSKDPFYHNEFIASRISVRYFEMIASILHLTQEEKERDDKDYDPRQKMGKMIDILNSKFKKYYINPSFLLLF